MRISSSLLQSRSLSGMQKQQSTMESAYTKVITNQRITNPSDDAYGAAKLVGLDNEMSKNTQYSNTRSEVNDQLQLQESALDSATSALQDVRSRLVQALNGTLTDDNRQALATDIRGSYGTLLSAANTRDGNGNYLFSGYKSDTAPFNIDESSMTITPTADGSDYQGGEQMSYRVDASRSLNGVATADKAFGTSDGDNVFSVIKDIVATLETSTTDGTTSVADIQSKLSSSLQQMDSSIDNISIVRAEGGTRMNEIEALDTQWANNKVNLQDSINELGAADMTEAISNYSLTQVGYEAAIRSYAMLNGTSLMDLL